MASFDISKTFERNPEGYQALTWVLYICSGAIALATLGEISGTLLLVGCIVVILLARTRKDDAAPTIYGSHLANISSVMTIAPGIFWTPMVDGMPAAVQESLSASIPFPSRLGQPGEFADLVAYIIGNRYLNGETIRLDGAVRLAPK